MRQNWQQQKVVIVIFPYRHPIRRNKREKDASKL